MDITRLHIWIDLVMKELALLGLGKLILVIDIIINLRQVSFKHRAPHHIDTDDVVEDGIT